MTSRVYQRSALLLLVILALLTACGGGGTTPTPGSAVTPDNANNTAVPLSPDANLPGTDVALRPTQQAGSLPVNDQGVPLVATVNGVGITLPQLDRAVARRQQQIDPADFDALRAEVLDELIRQEVITQAAAQMGITVSEAEVDAEINLYISEAGSPEAWQAWLTSNGYESEAELRAEVHSALLTPKVVAAVVNLNQDAEHVHARHILVYTGDEAAVVIERLNAGEDFALVAREMSKDTTTFENGGDLGWFTRDELLEPIVAEVAFSLQPGEIAGPVRTRLGYHIIQTLEFADRALAPESAEEEARLTELEFERWLAEQIDAAAIERFI